MTDDTPIRLEQYLNPPKPRSTDEEFREALRRLKALPGPKDPARTFRCARDGRTYHVEITSQDIIVTRHEGAPTLRLERENLLRWLLMELP